MDRRVERAKEPPRGDPQSHCARVGAYAWSEPSCAPVSRAFALGSTASQDAQVPSTLHAGEPSGRDHHRRRADTARFPLHRHRSGRRGRRRQPRVAVRVLDGSRRRDGRRRRAGRGRPRADRRRADRQGVLARQADLRPPPDAGGDQGGGGRQRRHPARPAARLGARQDRATPRGSSSTATAPISAACRSASRASTRAGSARATARSSTPPAASAAGRRPINLPIPPYTFVSDTKILIGEGATA